MVSSSSCIQYEDSKFLIHSHRFDGLRDAKGISAPQSEDNPLIPELAAQREACLRDRETQYNVFLEPRKNSHTSTELVSCKLANPSFQYVS